MDLEGRVALVTGAGAETGRAIALRLLAGGARVVVADVDREAAENTVEAIEAAGAAAVIAFVGDEKLAGRVVVLRGGELRRCLP